MAKVLRQGRDADGRTYRAECRACRTLFEFEADEARREPDFMDGDALVIDCPECLTEQWIAVEVAGA